MKARLGLVVAVGVLVLFGLAYVWNHDPRAGSFYPSCTFREATGFYCTGCGSSRAAHALVHLDLAKALRMNPLFVILVPLLSVVIAMEGAAWLLGKRYRGPRLRFRPGVAWSIPIVIFGFWILRNIPGWPFSLLAPH